MFARIDARQQGAGQLGAGLLELFHGVTHDLTARARPPDHHHRCIGVLERRLEGRSYILGDDYTIVDMICWPWVLIAKAMGQALEEFPNVTRWRAAVKSRPAVQRGVDLGKEFRRSAPPSDEERKIMFNQTARTAGEQSS